MLSWSKSTGGGIRCILMHQALAIDAGGSDSGWCGKHLLSFATLLVLFQVENVNLLVLYVTANVVVIVFLWG